MKSSDKPALVNNVPTPTQHPRTQAPHQEVARRAAQLWRERGYPAGKDDVIWLEAESLLQAEAESRPVAGASSPPPTEPAVPLRENTKGQDPTDAGAQTGSAASTVTRQNRPTLRSQ